MTVDQDTQNRIFSEALRRWNISFGGVSASELADALQVPHQHVMHLVEKWVSDGRGTMNGNVELNIIGLPEPGSDLKFSFTPITTHIFFPSRAELKEHFYNGGGARSNPSEFKRRLMCGAHQLALCFFSEEVLARYFDHLDWYQMDDSSAGGHIWTKSAAPDNRYVDVRFGKGKELNGKTFVTAIYKDLQLLSDAEQRHWHAYEIVDIDLDRSDKNFSLFLARTYEGSWVTFPKPIQRVQEAILQLNEVFKPNDLFGRSENEHLRTPVENTNKAFADSCSELYKVVGSDSLKLKPLKILLQSTFGKDEASFTHSSGRALSAIQVLEAAEVSLEVVPLLTDAIKAIATHRVDADHRVIATTSGDVHYGDVFSLLCENFFIAAQAVISAVELKRQQSKSN